MKKLMTLLGGVLLAAQSQAHVTIDPPVAKAGSYQKLSFKIGHGCDGSATTQLIVELPDSVHGAKPMPKPGWQTDIRIAPLVQAYKSHGKIISEEAREISWRGGELPDAYYDEFSMQVKLPDSPGKLYFRVRQICSNGENNWADIVAEGSIRQSSFPAPAIRLEAAGAPAAMNGNEATAGGHQH